MILSHLPCDLDALLRRVDRRDLAPHRGKCFRQDPAPAPDLYHRQGLQRSPLLRVEAVVVARCHPYEGRPYEDRERERVCVRALEVVGSIPALRTFYLSALTSRSLAGAEVRRFHPCPTTRWRVSRTFRSHEGPRCSTLTLSRPSPYSPPTQEASSRTTSPPYGTPSRYHNHAPASCTMEDLSRPGLCFMQFSI